MLLRYSPESTNCCRYCSRVTPRVSLKTNQELAQGVRPERPVRPFTAISTFAPASRALMAAKQPAKPPPMTRTSVSSVVSAGPELDAERGVMTSRHLAPPADHRPSSTTSQPCSDPSKAPSVISMASVGQYCWHSLHTWQSSR